MRKVHEQYTEVKRCVSKDIWMYVLSAAIGGIISFLVLKFWNSPETEATRKLKVPMEHDERQRWKTMPTLRPGVWKGFVETKRKKENW